MLANRWYAKHSDYYKNYVKNMRNEKREVFLAYCAVANAIKSGTIIRPDNCEKCGSTVNIQAHHDDYSKQLDIKWWCTQCHSGFHRKQKKIAA